jgi:MFS family permease
MKESLNMHGSELTYASNVFTAGYVVGQIPAVILASRIRPSILIPTMEILWSVLTFCTSTITNVSHLYAIRFLIGLCESAYFPVMIVSTIGYLQKAISDLSSISYQAGTPKKSGEREWLSFIAPLRCPVCLAVISRLARIQASMANSESRAGR